jgi:hypothetical protein
MNPRLSEKSLPPAGFASAGRKAFAALPELLFAAALLIVPGLILINLNRGIDFSDSGYYALSIRHLAEITNSASQFGTVWRLLPLPDSVYGNRIAIALLMAVSLGHLLGAMRALAWPQSGQHLSDRLANWIAGAATASLYYFYWVPDPSYNSVALCLNAAALAEGFYLTRKLREGQRASAWRIGCSGFILLLLALTRPPTALGIGLILSAFVLTVARPNGRDIARLALFGLAGGAAAVAVISVLVEPITVSIARMEMALAHKFETGLSHADLFAQLQTSLSDNFSRQAGLAFALAVGIGLLTARLPATWPERYQKSTNWLGAALSFGALAWLVWSLYVQSDRFAAINLGQLADSLSVIAGAGFAGIILPIIAGLVWRQKSANGLLAAIILALLGAWGSQVAMTMNDWYLHAAQFAVFPLAILFVICMKPGDAPARLVRLASLAVLLVFQLMAWQHMSQNPYRLPTPLAQQLMPTPLRGGASTLLTDTRTHDFLTRIDAAAQPMGPYGQRPVLIDLTGRVPLITYHLNAAVPGNPWALSGYPGSQEMFNRALDGVSAAQLQRAWIIDAPDLSIRHNPEALAARGRVLSRDYVEVFRGRSDYLDTEIVLLAPRNTPGLQ